MHLHEFQAKEELRRAGILVPDFIVASKIEDLKQKLEKKGWQESVIKVQVHAGGRGKSGGVLFAKNQEEAVECAKKLLGMKIINEQTGKEGMVAHQVLISEAVDIKKEYYLGAVIERKSGKAMLIASPEGGVEIEEIAQKCPDKIAYVPIMMDGTLKFYHLIRIAKIMGWDWKNDEAKMKLLKNFAHLFMHSDAALLEINPLVETFEGKIVALDAKMTIDENALFRQKHLASYYDASQLPASEAQAKEHDLAYIAMDGTIGCMVNGAGLAMSTMDIIQYHGGSVANFLDVGGSATQERVLAGFQIILSDPKVCAILVNIFGGIMDCVTIASAIIATASEGEIHVPLIVRMEGTNVEKGKKMLKDSGLNIIVAQDLTDAAQKAVYAAAPHRRN